MTHDSQETIKVVISGSFRQHYEGICDVIRSFEQLGIEVLSPKSSNMLNPDEEFVFLETDETRCPIELEQRHLDAICKADALYLFNPDGYVGLSSGMEVGWAFALRIPVYAKEECVDMAFRHFVQRVLCPADVKTDIQDRRNNIIADTLNGLLSLRFLQSYVQRTAALRGFGGETPHDKLLLMLEEFGELARSFRKSIGLKIDKNRKQDYTELKQELADILFYLLDISNSCDIDLHDAFQEKERKNAKRNWESTK